MSKNDPPQVFIGYVSAYGNTERLADAVAEAVRAAGLDVTLMNVSEKDPLDVVQNIDRADGVLLGSPTINRDVLKPVWDVLSSVSAYRNKGKIAGAFGSYGWSGEAVQMIEDRLKSLGLKIVGPGFRTKLVPDASALTAAREYGQLFAAALQQSRR